MTDTFACVAKFALGRSARDMPISAREAAALLMLDTMGILIASGPMEAGVIARDTAALLYASSDPSYSARMMFDGRQVSMAGATYAAATQTDNLDGHDGYNPVKGHIGVVVLPALAALAEHCPDLTGPEALAAVITGYEVAGTCRFVAARKCQRLSHLWGLECTGRSSNGCALAQAYTRTIATSDGDR